MIYSLCKSQNIKFLAPNIQKGTILRESLLVCMCKPTPGFKVDSELGFGSVRETCRDFWFSRGVKNQEDCRKG